MRDSRSELPTKGVRLFGKASYHNVRRCKNALVSTAILHSHRPGCAASSVISRPIEGPVDQPSGFEQLEYPIKVPGTTESILVIERRLQRRSLLRGTNSRSKQEKPNLRGRQTSRAHKLCSITTAVLYSKQCNFTAQLTALP